METVGYLMVILGTSGLLVTAGLRGLKKIPYSLLIRVGLGTAVVGVVGSLMARSAFMACVHATTFVLWIVTSKIRRAIARQG